MEVIIIRLQHISDSTIENLTQFGRHLQQLLEQPEACQIIATFGSFQQGGCLVLARALKILEPSLTLWVVVRDIGVNDHVVARYKDVFLDGDGLGNELDILEKMRIHELVAAQRIEQLEEAELDKDIKSDPKIEEHLAAWLRSRLSLQWLKTIGFN
jgi:hypothetical protein